MKKIALIKKILNFKTFAQFYEDLILFCVFHDVEKGFYIDIGANDPDILSVTKAFYLKGWNGINIEPLPDKYNSLVKIRPKDINLQIGVSRIKGNSTLYLLGSGSTMQKNFSNNQSQIININIDTMSNICEKYIKKGEDIQFCKIDVEGEEKNVLLGYDFEKYRPKVFVIESTLPGTIIPSYSSWEYILLNNNYSFAYQYNINRYYIDNKIENLNRKFLKLDNYIKLYSSFHNSLLKYILF